MFTIVDTNALDFMAQYNLALAGDRELLSGIKRTILNGIATGKGADDIVQDMGKVIIDKDSFRARPEAGCSARPSTAWR